MLDIDEAVAGQAAGITIASPQGGETPGSVNDDRLASAIEPASAAAVQVSPTGVEHLVESSGHEDRGRNGEDVSSHQVTCKALGAAGANTEPFSRACAQPHGTSAHAIALYRRLRLFVLFGRLVRCELRPCESSIRKRRVALPRLERRKGTARNQRRTVGQDWTDRSDTP